MPELMLYQFQFEVNALKRFLSFMMEENVFLKNRIAEVLKNAFNNKMLEQIEIFQNRFVMQDDLISLLRNDVALLEKLLAKQTTFMNDSSIDDIGKMTRELSRNMENTEQQFMKLRSAFNIFLEDTLVTDNKVH